MDDASGFQVLVGLGNPGSEYANTRHNIGFAVIDELARRRHTSFQFDAKWDGEAARADSLWLLKPMTFMNLSGESVAQLTHFYKVPPANVLVILDDMALPLGHLRLRKGGSPGGHHGLESVILHLHTEEIPRLRIGIGSATHAVTDHVLGKFLADERPLVDTSIQRAADAVEHCLTQGLDSAMNLYNQTTSTTTP